VLFVVLERLARRKHRDGDVIIAYTALYAAARFVLEFFRGDADRGFVFGGALSTSQFIGIVMFCLAAVAWASRRAERIPAGRRTRSRG
jgi:phosphatidylglycerol:prolipoprotein diacylglycerol transferase